MHNLEISSQNCGSRKEWDYDARPVSGLDKLVFETLEDIVRNNLQGIGGKFFKEGRKGIILGPTDRDGTNVEMCPNGEIAIVDSKDISGDPELTAKQNNLASGMDINVLLRKKGPWTTRELSFKEPDRGYRPEKLINYMRKAAGDLILYLKEISEDSDMYDWPEDKKDFVDIVKDILSRFGYNNK